MDVINIQEEKARTEAGARRYSTKNFRDGRERIFDNDTLRSVGNKVRNLLQKTTRYSISTEFVNEIREKDRVKSAGNVDICNVYRMRMISVK